MGLVAVIDIGSNSIRLVVFDGLKRAFLPLFNEKVICGLGRGLLDARHLPLCGGYRGQFVSSEKVGS